MGNPEMTNAERYHFADFTRDNYRRLLDLARRTYVCRTYVDFAKDERFVLWRHDVDFSVHAARKMAGIEAEEGVVATYFLHLHNAFYNLLERETTDCVRDILSLGHQIGLHFDTAYHNIADLARLETWLQREARVLEDLFGQPIRVFSFDNPSPFAASCREWQYAGMINTYAEYFQTTVGYCSDSNCYWRFRRLEEVLTSAQDLSLQVLAHPECWQDTVMSPRQRINRCIDGRAEKARLYYATLLEASGRENVDWE
jgi:hypothetical protein